MLLAIALRPSGPGLDTQPQLQQHFRADCPAPPATGVPVSVDILTSIDIDRPRAQVAAFAGDPSRAPEWYVNIKIVEWQTAPPVALGSQVAFVARFLGRRLAYTYEVVELVPGERLVMQTAQGPFPMRTEYTWADTPAGGTRMTLRNSGEPSGFSQLAAPFMAAAMKRANSKDLALLKQVLERR